MKNPFMKLAIDLATENARTGRGGPFGAVVVKGGKLIAQAVNCVTSQNDPTAHAEIVAIREACKVLGTFQLAGCEIFASCEPCPMCLGAIYWARPARVYFAGTRKDAANAGFDDSFIYSELQMPFDQRRIPINQIMREEAMEAFQAWKAKVNKIEY